MESKDGWFGFSLLGYSFEMVGIRANVDDMDGDSWVMLQKRNCRWGSSPLCTMGSFHSKWERVLEGTWDSISFLGCKSNVYISSSWLAPALISLFKDPHGSKTWCHKA